MKRPDQLENYIIPDASNAFGRLKDTIYDGGAVSEVGSRIKADWAHDILTVFHKIAGNKGISLNGTADTTAASQAYDLLFGEVTDYQNGKVDPIARQLSFSKWSAVTSSSRGPSYTNSERYSNGAGADGKFVFLYWSSSYIVSVVWAFGRIQSETDVHEKPFGQNNDQTIIHDGTYFITAQHQPSLTLAPKIYRSTDGEVWANISYDSDVTRSGGRTIAKVGSTLIIPAFDDADNSYYTSTDNGGTWGRVPLVATSPLYDPIVSASSGSEMVWVSSSGTYVRHFDGTMWTDCTINGGTLTNSGDNTLDKDIIYTGGPDGRFVIRDQQDKLFVSRSGDATIFDSVLLTDPLTAGERPDLIAGGNGLLYMSKGSIAFTCKEDRILEGAWMRVSGPSTGQDPTAIAFDGRQHCTAASRDDTADQTTAINYTHPVEL